MTRSIRDDDKVTRQLCALACAFRRRAHCEPHHVEHVDAMITRMRADAQKALDLKWDEHLRRVEDDLLALFADLSGSASRRP